VILSSRNLVRQAFFKGKNENQKLSADFPVYADFFREAFDNVLKTIQICVANGQVVVFLARFSLPQSRVWDFAFCSKPW